MPKQMTKNEFRRYLEKSGVVDVLEEMLVRAHRCDPPAADVTHQLLGRPTAGQARAHWLCSAPQVALYDEPSKPSNAMDFMRSYIGVNSEDTEKAAVIEENASLKAKVEDLVARLEAQAGAAVSDPPRARWR
jgi:hypothetical protein